MDDKFDTNKIITRLYSVIYSRMSKNPQNSRLVEAPDGNGTMILCKFCVSFLCAYRLHNQPLMPTTYSIETNTISATRVIDLDLENDSAKQTPMKEKTVNRTLRMQSTKQSTNSNRPGKQNTLKVNNRHLVLKKIIAIDVIGIVGNAFALVILHRKAMLELPGSLFLRTLTGTDLLFLLCSQLDMQLRNKYFLICKIGTFFCKSFQFYSKYITLSFSLERFIVICFPLTCFPTASQASRKLKIYLSILFMLLVVICVPEYFMMTDTITPDGRSGCVHKYAHEHWFSEVYKWIDMVLNIIPAVGIIVCNVGIIISVVCSAKTIVKETRLANTQVMSITAMMLLVSLTYVVLTMPDSLILSGLIVPRLVGMLGVHINHACNILLYIISGKIFRQEVKQLYYLVVRWVSRLTRIDVTEEEDMQAKGPATSTTSVSRPSGMSLN